MVSVNFFIIWESLILGQGQGASRGQYQSRLKGNRGITGRPGWWGKKKNKPDEIDDAGVMVKRGDRWWWQWW